MMLESAFLCLAAAAGLAAAASVSRAAISACGTAVNNILTATDPNLGCIAPAGIKAVISQAVTLDDGSSTVPTAAVDDWLTQMCGVGFCSPQTLQRIAATITGGCGASFGAFKLPAAAQFVSTLTTDYPIFRQMMCLRNSAAGNKFCMTEAFVQSVSSKIDFADPAGTVQSLINLASNGDCNQCTKAAFQLINKVIPLGSDKITKTCGPAFGDINAPPIGISQAAINVAFPVTGAPSGNSAGNTTADSAGNTAGDSAGNTGGNTGGDTAGNTADDTSKDSGNNAAILAPTTALTGFIFGHRILFVTKYCRVLPTPHQDIEEYLFCFHALL
ncbi:hypothetical protein DFH09DRAFT_1279004 [Mycena vulgaris]|nr:hypothetical protein DFH09DRAFT_1279004 [Mycena vulgaris]